MAQRQTTFLTCSKFPLPQKQSSSTRGNRKGSLIANPECIKVLKQGVAAWKKWCAEHPRARLDADLEGADLRGANLSQISLSHAHLRGADLSEATLANANFVMADLSEAVLRSTNLHGAKLEQANLKHSDLSEADLRHARLRGANLEEASLVKASLDDGDLWGANLTYANLEGASLRLALANEANLRRANLRHADLWRARLDHALLEEADLTYASLAETDLTEALLSGADFSHVLLRKTLLNTIDLSKAKGLETIKHDGRSFVDLLTLHYANGKLPLNFLQGVGLPDRAIDYAQTAERSAVQISCFLLYTPSTQNFVERLSTDLQSRGIRCWPRNMERDQSFLFEDEPISYVSDKYLLVIPQEVARGWGELMMMPGIVARELQAQIQLLIPLCISAETKEAALQWWKGMYSRSWDIAVERNSVKNPQMLFSERAMLDFSLWQDEKVYQRILQDLIAVMK